MLSIENLKILSNGVELVNSISVSLLPGSITYIKGANGSGKTSFLQILSGLKTNFSGKIKLYGQNLSNFYKPYCLSIGHNLGLEDEMTVLEQIEFWSGFYNSKPMIPAAIQFWDLHEILDTKISKLSAGTKKKVALSKLTACQSDLWLLDETDTNLDEHNQKFLEYAIISKSQSGGIVLIASHNTKQIKNTQSIFISDFN